jgi:hypothetical protein
MNDIAEIPDPEDLATYWKSQVEAWKGAGVSQIKFCQASAGLAAIVERELGHNLSPANKRSSCLRQLKQATTVAFPTVLAHV